MLAIQNCKNREFIAVWTAQWRACACVRACHTQLTDRPTVQKQALTHSERSDRLCSLTHGTSPPPGIPIPHNSLPLLHPQHFIYTFKYFAKNIELPLIRINWGGVPSGRAENPDNWIFLWKQATLAVWRSAVTIYSMYLRLNLTFCCHYLQYVPASKPDVLLSLFTVCACV